VGKRRWGGGSEGGGEKRGLYGGVVWYNCMLYVLL